jgi:hypothetical protein
MEDDLDEEALLAMQDEFENERSQPEPEFKSPAESKEEKKREEKKAHAPRQRDRSFVEDDVHAETPPDNSVTRLDWQQALVDPSTSADDLVFYADVMGEMWGDIGDNKQLSEEETYRLAKQRYPWVREDFLRSQHDSYLAKFWTLCIQLHNTIGSSDTWPAGLASKLTLIRERIEHYFNLRVSLARVNKTYCSAFIDPNFTFLQHNLWQPEGTQDASEHMQAILCVQQRTIHLGLRHHDDKVFKPVRNAQGRFVYAYEPYKVDGDEKYDIVTVLHSFVRDPATSMDFPLLYRSGHTIGRVADALTLMNSVAFPKLRTSSTHTSYRNGIYDADKDTFMPYDQLPAHYSTISCMFIDQDFDLYDQLRGDFLHGNWFDISAHCPHYMQILRHQIPEKSADKPDGYTNAENIQRFLIAFLGRLLFPTGSKDNWQRALVIQGEAGTGKSLLIDVAVALRQPDDVESMSNEMETTFGLDPLADKLLITMSEMGANCKLSQSDFNSMVTGERMSIRGKHKKAYTIPNFLSSPPTASPHGKISVVIWCAV